MTRGSQDTKVKNINRDLINTNKLIEQGWQVLRIWESEIYKNVENTINSIIYFLKN